MHCWPAIFLCSKIIVFYKTSDHHAFQDKKKGKKKRRKPDTKFTGNQNLRRSYNCHVKYIRVSKFMAMKIGPLYKL